MSTPRGILAAGNFIVDHVKVIDAFPEQDTLVHILDECEANGGGPYNLLKDLAAMGVDYPLLACGVVGDDEKGRWIRRDCTAHHINTDQLHVSGEKPTSYTDAMTVRDSGRRTFFHQRGTNDLFDWTHCDFTRVRARIFYLGYLMLLGTLDTLDAEGKTGATRLLERASAAGMITAVDLVSTDHPSYREIVLAALPHTDHLLLNELEASRILGSTVDAGDPEGLVAAARKIMQLGVRRTVTIHSSSGAACFSATDGAVLQPALVLPAGYIAGATGAGDAFAAGFLHGIHEGMPLARCLHLATCCAAASLNHPSPSAGIPPVKECLALGDRFAAVDSRNS